MVVSAVDPLNLTGVLFPGPKVPRLRTHEVRYVDGLPDLEGQPVRVSGSRSADLLGRGL